MKKALVIIVFCFISMGLTACGGAGSSSDASQSTNLFGDLDLKCGSESCME